MPTFNAMRQNFTPSSFTTTSAPNWCLDAVGTGVFGKIVMITWGGQLATSTGYATRWVRPTTAGTGAKTAITIGYNQPNYTTAAFTATSSYATTQPTVPAQAVGDLYVQSWNAQGGVGAIALPLANPWWVATGVLVGAFECQNYTGVDANGSSYGVSWEE